jgi:hypothetical protein
VELALQSRTVPFVGRIVERLVWRRIEPELSQIS